MAKKPEVKKEEKAPAVKSSAKVEEKAPAVKAVKVDAAAPVRRVRVS